MENEERITPDEARAVIRLWSRRQWERQHWPTVADIAEGLDIPVAEVEFLLWEARENALNSSAPEGLFPSNPALKGRVKALPKALPLVFRLATSVAGLIGLFCVFLSRLLS